MRKIKVLFVILLSFFIFPSLQLDVFAINIPKEPVITSVHAYKAKSNNEKTTFKIYLENYNPEYVKVKKAGNQFKTKFYIFEEDNIMMQPETIDYKAENELKTSQAIDLAKRYYAQVEFISYDKYDNKVVDSKKSEKFEFKFVTNAKTEEKKNSSESVVDKSKVYVKKPKIVSGSHKNTEVELRLEDYNQTYAEIKNNSEFLGEVTIYERKLNTVKVISLTEFNDYSMDRHVKLSAPLSSNNEYVAVVRFAAIENGKKVYSPTSNEFILKEKLNTEKYNMRYTPNHLVVTNTTYLFPNEAELIEPERPITRGEVALAFYSLLSERAKSDYYARNSLFLDNIPTKFNEAISTMAKMRVINGYEDNTFKASNPITRAEFVAVAMKFYKDDVVGNASFSDVPSNFWGKSAISKAVSMGIINGYADGTFKPNNPITRAEAAKIINRITGRVGFESQYKNKYIDNAPSKWYYEEIKVAN